MKFDDRQRQVRLARRHFLSTPASDPVEAARALCGYHGTDPATVFLSAAARTRSSFEDIAHEMYEARTLVRLLAMRRTVFTFSLDVAAEAFAGCTTAVARKARKGLLKVITSTEVTHDPEKWLQAVEAKTLEALSNGPVLGADLADRVPELQTTFEAAPGKSYNRTLRITSRVLDQLAATGRIVRAHATGSITSSRYHWAKTEDWLGRSFTETSETDAQKALARRWLAAYGPATTDDLQWWTGWTKTATRKALASLGAVSVRLEIGDGWILPGDEAEQEELAPTAALLPALDPTAMGWKHRGFYNGDRDARRYDRNGNICPTVWWDGAIVGGWAQRADGGIELELEDCGRAAHTAIETQADQLEATLGELRVRPRFPTPLDKELGTR